MAKFTANWKSLAFIVLSNNRAQKCATERQTDRHTDEIIYVRFRRYVCMSFANFLLHQKYAKHFAPRIAHLNNMIKYHSNMIIIHD